MINGRVAKCQPLLKTEDIYLCSTKWRCRYRVT